MAELKITDLVDQAELDKVRDLADSLEEAKTKYTEAAKALAKGLKMKVEVVGDIDKLNTLLNVQSQKASEGSDALNQALKKQQEITKKLTESIDEMVKSGKLSAKEAKEIADASKKNAEAMEKEAKAEATLNKSRKQSVKTEADRKRIIKEALELTNKEVHSIEEANEANKKLRAAVKLVRDTDDDYAKTLGKLNSTIGVNTDYVKRNSDRYTQQKMTVGDYKEQIKLAWMEINKGNGAMKNMGIIASSTGKMLKASFSSGLKEVGSSVGMMIKGFVGAQAVISGITRLWDALKNGARTAMEFSEANSRLAAILGTTAKKTKDLQVQARELGATTRYTAAQATDLQIELAKLGFTTQEIKDSTKYVLRFAQATGSELSEAAALSGAALRMFNADTVETERYVSAMAIATTKSALSFSYLATALPIVGPVAKSFNFTIEDTLALLGKLADSGFDASMAATATRNIFLNLADTNGKLAKTLGKPITNLDELSSALVELRERGVDLNTTLQLTDKRSVAAFNAFLTAADKIKPLREQITGVESDLEDMAGEMVNNTSGSIKTLESAWEEMMISIYGNTGAIRDFIDTCTEGVRWVTNLVRSNEDLAEIQKEQAAQLGSDAANESLKRQIEYVNAAKDSYVKAGKDETEALELAKKERMDILKSLLDEETKMRDEAYNKNQKLWKEKNDASFFKQGLGLEKSNAEFDKEINKSWDEYLQHLSYAKSLEVQLSGIDRMKNKEVEKKKKNPVVLGDAEKEAREREKAARESEDAVLAIMDEGVDKQIALITLSYNRKMAAIKGHSKEEEELRKALGEKMQHDIASTLEEFELARQNADLSNRLASVEKGSEEEKEIRLQILESQHEAELHQAERTGADVAEINEKYLSMRAELEHEYAANRVADIQESAAAEQAVRDRNFSLEMSALEQKKARGVISTEEYEKEKYQITLEYLKKTADAMISSLEMQLQQEGLTNKERQAISEQIADAKAKLAKDEADLEIEAIKKVEDADKKSKDKRMKDLQTWMQAASDAVGTIGDFISTLYDGQMAKVDEQSEKNQEAHDAEIERIEHLEETGAISKEESEARKRAAEAKTEQKEKELDKKRKQIAYKQALWQKATSIAQAGIATALAITQALPNIVLAALIGAMGAIQVATIIATPIPKYAKGTMSHPGGPAVVGDGGRREAVITDRGMWITPDVPTIVDLPKNAVVLPDASKIESSPMKDIAMSSVGKLDTTTVINDYSKLEKKADMTNYLLSQWLKNNNRWNSSNELREYMRDKS